MTGAPIQRRLDRTGPVVAVAAIHLLVGYWLVVGMRGNSPAPLADARLSLIRLDPLPPPAPKPPPPMPRAFAGKSGAPPKAPVPLTPAPEPALPAPPPLVATPPPLVGAAPADSSIGGIGGGGSGGTGAGTGGGDGAGAGFSPARQTRGSFRNSDFPASARGIGRVRIGVRYAVGPAGVIDRCEIIDTSGHPEVDAMTCRVIAERYRFKPARDGRGVPVTQVIEEDYTWRID